MATHSKVRVYGHSLYGIAGSNCRRHGCRYLVNVVCCQVEVPALGWSLLQRSPTECGVCERDREAGIIRPWQTRDCCAMEVNSSLFDPPFVFSYCHPPTILLQRQSVGGSGLYYTVKNLWQALSWILHETKERILYMFHYVQVLIDVLR